MSARCISSNPIGRRWCWPQRWGSVPTASDACACDCRKGWPDWSASSYGLKWWRMPPVIRVSSTSARRLDPYHSFLAFRLSIADGCRECWSFNQEARVFQRDAVRMLTTAGTQLAPIVGHARTLGHFVAPAHQRLEALARNMWWSWDDDAASLFAPSILRCGASSSQTPSRCFSNSGRSARGARLASAAQPHQLRVSPHAGAHEVDPARGGRERGRAWARPVAYFSAEFGFTSGADLFGAASASSRAITSKRHRISAFRWLVWGLYYSQGYFTQRFDLSGYHQEDYREVDSSLLPWSRRKTRRAFRWPLRIERVPERSMARVWKLAVGRTTLLLPIRCRRQSSGRRGLTSRLYGGDDRVSHRQELLPAWRRSGADGPRISPGGVVHLNEGHSGFRGARAGPPAEYHRRRRCFRSACAESPRRSCHHSYACAAGHDRFPPHLVEEHLGPLREALEIGRVSSSASVGQSRRSARRLLHDDSRIEAVAACNTRVIAAWPVSRAMWTPLYRRRSERRVPTVISPRYSRAHLARASDASDL